VFHLLDVCVCVCTCVCTCVCVRVCVCVCVCGSHQVVTIHGVPSLASPGVFQIRQARARSRPTGER